MAGHWRLSDYFDISGSVVYGGELTDAERADDDPVDNHISDDAVGARELIISGIDLSAGGSYPVTYEDVTVQETEWETVLSLRLSLEVTLVPARASEIRLQCQWMRAEL